MVRAAERPCDVWSSNLGNRSANETLMAAKRRKKRRKGGSKHGLVRWLALPIGLGLVGLAGYLLCDTRERACWWLTGSDLATLGDGAPVVFASHVGPEIETKVLALMKSGRRGSTVKLNEAPLVWDIAALFRVQLGTSSPSAEQGLVFAPGARFPRV